MGTMRQLRQLFGGAGPQAALFMFGYALYQAFGYMSFESSTMLASLGEQMGLAQSIFLALALCGRVAVYAIALVVRLRLPRSDRSAMPLVLAALVAMSGFLLTHLSFDFAAYAPFEKAVPWLMTGGALFGAGGALANLMWARLSGSFDLGQIYRLVLSSNLMSLVVYLAITLLPAGAVFPAGIALFLTSVGICHACLARQANVEEEFSHPVFHGAVSTLWRPTLGTAILYFMSGLMLQMPHNQEISLPQFQYTSVVTQAVVIAALLLPSLLLRGRPSLSAVYKVALPLSATGFLLLPLIWSGGAGIANACAQLGAGVASIILWCMVADMAHDTRLPAGLLFSGALLATGAAQLAGTAVGLLFREQLDQGSIALTGIALVAVYLVAMVSMFLFKDRGLRGIDDTGDALTSQGVGELAEQAGQGAGNPSMSENSASRGTNHQVPGNFANRGIGFGGPHHDLVGSRPFGASEGSLEGTARSTERADALAVRCAELAERFGLTPRETELLAQLGRGLTVRAISEELTVSENTVKYHIKSIYQKLAVHSRDEVIALIEGTPAEGSSE